MKVIMEDKYGKVHSSIRGVKHESEYTPKTRCQAMGHVLKNKTKKIKC